MNYKFSIKAKSSLLASEIPPEVAEYASIVFSEISEELAIIARKRKIEKANSVADITHHRHVDLLIAMMIDDGATLDDAIIKLSYFDISEKNIRFLWSHIGSRIKAKKQKEKIKAAQRMHKQGKDTKFISKKLGVTIRTAQRYLNQ